MSHKLFIPNRRTAVSSLVTPQGVIARGLPSGGGAPGGGDQLRFGQSTRIVTTAVISVNTAARYRFEAECAHPGNLAVRHILYKTTNVNYGTGATDITSITIGGAANGGVALPGDNAIHLCGWEKVGDTQYDLTVDAGLQNRNVGQSGNVNALIIGSNLANVTFQGVIRNVKVFDTLAGDVLLHHWPVDVEVADGGNIPDIVGGADGTLTLATGTWEARQ